jgi:IS30 family transposase
VADTMIEAKNKTAMAKYEVLVARLRALPRVVRLSITTDNGMENAKHKRISKTLGMPMYFCHSYASWEKGTVENTNGRIRRFLPKGRSIDAVTDEEIRQVEHFLNHTPRKRLDYLTPFEVLALAVRKDAQTIDYATTFY